MTEKSNEWDWSPREADKYAEGPSDYEVVFRTSEFMAEKAIIDWCSQIEWMEELASRHPEDMVKNAERILKLITASTKLSKNLERIFLQEEKRRNMKPEKRHEAG